MGLIVRQYKENGSKYLDMMIETRDKEKSQITTNLNQQKEQMAAVYEAAKTLVNDVETNLKSSAIIKVEHQWRREQDAIQRRIDEGRKMML